MSHNPFVSAASTTGRPFTPDTHLFNKDPRPQTTGASTTATWRSQAGNLPGLWGGTFVPAAAADELLCQVGWLPDSNAASKLWLLCGSLPRLGVSVCSLCLASLDVSNNHKTFLTCLHSHGTCRRRQQQEWQQQPSAQHECTAGAATHACVAACQRQEAGCSCIIIWYTGVPAGPCEGGPGQWG